MQNWIGLQHICEVTQGAPLSRLRHENGIPFRIIQIGNLNTLEPDDDLEVERLSSRAPYVRPGDVLVSLRGSPIRAAVVPEGMDDCVASPNIAILSLRNPRTPMNDDGLDPYFLAGLFSSDYMNRALNAYLGGGAVPSLSVRTLRALKVPVLEPQLQRDFAEAFKAHNRTTVNSQKLVAFQRERLEAELTLQLGENHA